MRTIDRDRSPEWGRFASDAAGHLASYCGVSIRTTDPSEPIFYNAQRIHAAYLDIITGHGKREPYTEVDDYVDRWSPPPSTAASLATGAHVSLYIPRHPEKPPRTGRLYDSVGSGLVIREDAVAVGAMLLTVGNFKAGAFYMLLDGENGTPIVQKLDSPDVASRRDEFLCVNGALPPYMPSLPELRALPSLMQQAAELY
jgi:hypothetical protein